MPLNISSKLRICMIQKRCTTVPLLKHWSASCQKPPNSHHNRLPNVQTRISNRSMHVRRRTLDDLSLELLLLLSPQPAFAIVALWPDAGGVREGVGNVRLFQYASEQVIQVTIDAY
ncbi:hypothetical protein JTE90_008743 [Oedothorax gibbosus]|uniref:Uncharacterized protein n=1 Tax=Oedothorax gibbosus TaxID=931172 RepID=A0AAV6URI2_9ARAC|nr:hypothetical protein JTE90_008743 [Oedothorax gibbosus]